MTCVSSISNDLFVHWAGPAEFEGLGAAHLPRRKVSSAITAFWEQRSVATHLVTHRWTSGREAPGCRSSTQGVTPSESRAGQYKGSATHLRYECRANVGGNRVSGSAPPYIHVFFPSLVGFSRHFSSPASPLP